MNIRIKTALRVKLATLASAGLLFLSPARAAIQTPDLSAIKTALIADLHQAPQSGQNFETLSRSWAKRFGSGAYQALIDIAESPSETDSNRYIALMSAVKVGGTGAIQDLARLTTHPLWMLRSGSIRALAVLGNSKIGELILPRLKDDALVVRTEAVDAIRVLRPLGAERELMTALEDPSNYYHGKAQWVPDKALAGLANFSARQYLPRLKALSTSSLLRNDPQFKKRILETCELLKQ